ncbi:MAG: hypothetical protein K8S00_01100 [Bacteroidales bacterium]|nr:hypothetical protein [Bacteroidales bacterium]
MVPIKFIEPQEHQPKRPELLTILCVLSFIGSGLGSFSNLIITLSYSSIVEIYSSSGIDIPGMEEMLSGGRTFFTLSFIIQMLSFIGVLNMWKLNKIGFHIYSISQILILILPSFFIPELDFPIIAILFTAVFIILYASMLKHMS